MNETEWPTVVRPASAAIDGAGIDSWCAEFGAHWPECEEDPTVVPGVAITTFTRPPDPPRPGEILATGLELHDLLKRRLGLTSAIAVGYRLEVTGRARVGDRLRSEERVERVGPERPTRLGIGRDWVVSVTTTTLDGRPVAVEHWTMTAFRADSRPVVGTPTGSTSSARTSSTGMPSTPTPATPMPSTRGDSEHAAAHRPEWTEVVAVDRQAVRRGARANRVWMPIHHESHEARRLGLPDIVVDTSTQIGHGAARASRRHPGRIIAGVELLMYRPIHPDHSVLLEGGDDGADTVMIARVDGRRMSELRIVWASGRPERPPRLR